MEGLLLPIHLFIACLHLFYREMLPDEASCRLSKGCPVGMGDDIAEDMHILLMTVAMRRELPAGRNGLVKSFAVAADHGESGERCLDGHQRQTLEFRRHEHIVERSEITGDAEYGVVQRHIGERAELRIHKVLQLSASHDMEMILRHILQLSYYIYKVGNSFLLVIAAGKEYVRLAVYEEGTSLLPHLGYSIVYNRWHAAILTGVTVKNGLRYGDIGIVALIEAFHFPAKALQSCPQTCVMDGSHYAAAPLQPREDSEESPQTHIGGLRVGMYHIRSIAQPYIQEAQREEHGCYPLCHKMIMETWHP